MRLKGLVKDRAVEIAATVFRGKSGFVGIFSVPDRAILGGCLLAIGEKFFSPALPMQRAVFSFKVQKLVKQLRGLYHVNHVANLHFAARAGSGGANALRSDIIPYFKGDSKK
jgi:hypothetical protein